MLFVAVFILGLLTTPILCILVCYIFEFLTRAPRSIIGTYAFVFSETYSITKQVVGDLIRKAFRKIRGVLS